MIKHIVSCAVAGGYGEPRHLGKTVICSCGCGRELFVMNHTIQKAILSGCKEENIQYICPDETLRVLKDSQPKMFVMPTDAERKELTDYYDKLNKNN